MESLRRRLDAEAREHLGDQLGTRWSSMLAEGAHLVATAGSSEPVGRLGGPAPLARGAGWPTWEGHGPMAHVATLDCRRLHPHLPPALRDAGFPRDGLLSFFYFDGQVDDGVEVVGTLFGTGGGARVVHTPPGLEVVLTEPPAPVGAYRSVELRAEPVLTWPTTEHPELDDEDVADDAWDDLLDTLDAVREDRSEPLHQVGGHPDPVQGPVETELSYGVLSEGGRKELDATDPAVVAHAREWMLLGQFDTDDDAGFMWGDAGVLYFMIRPDDLAAGAFENVGFTWQCS